MYEIDKLETIFIGYQGENETRTIAIDVSSWVKEFPQGRIAILHSRPTEQNPYIVANATVNNGVLEWVVNGADVGIAGMGYAVVQMSYNEQVLKTAVFTTKIGKTLDGTISPTPTPPAPSWVTDILNSRAEQFNINEQGHLIVTKVDGTTEDLGNVVGRGISSIAKTGTATVDGRVVDTYTITYTDGNTATFTVTNGKDGATGVGVPSGGTVGQVLTKKSGTNYDTEWRTLPKTVPLVSGSDMAAAVSDYPPAYSNGYIVQCSSTYGAYYLEGLFYKFFSRASLVYYWIPLNVDFYRKTGKQIDKSDYRMMTSDVDIFLCTEDYATPSSILTDDTAFHQGYSYLYTGIDNKTLKKKFTRINTQPSSGGGTPDYPDLTNKPKINNVELSGNKSAADLGLLGSSDTLAVGSVEVDVNSVKAYDYEQTYTIPQDITSGSTVRVEFAHGLREFTLEITTPETVIAAGIGYFYLTLDNGNSGGRFWEPALGQSHASKLCVSFTVGRDGIYRLNGYKYDLTNNSDYSLMTSYNTLARQNIGRLFLENPRPIASIYFTSGGDISELAGTTIKVRGLKW